MVAKLPGQKSPVAISGRSPVKRFVSPPAGSKVQQT